MHDYWLRQTQDQPLFPDSIWSRPEQQSLAGKLLIIGGNAYGFSAAAEAYAAASRAGIGTARVLLPDSLQKTVGKVFTAGEYAPSTPSGSFGQQALAEMLDMSSWSEAVLLAGDFGRNSETAIVIEQFLETYNGLLALTGDALDYVVSTPAKVLDRAQTLLIPSFAQLQKIAPAARFATAFRLDMGMLRFIEVLHEFKQLHTAHLMINFMADISCAAEQRISTTKIGTDQKPSDVALAAQGITWWLQSPTKPFEALTTSVIYRP
jgi:hypothetical protein